MTELPPKSVTTGTTPVTQLFVVNHALPWHLIVQNTAGGDLTTLRLRSRTHTNGPWTPWESVPSGLPVSEGDTISLVEIHTLAQAIEVELTAASAGAAALWWVGAPR
jgi:hypothetical protein